VRAIACSGTWFTADGKVLFPLSSIFWAGEGGLPHSCPMKRSTVA